MTRPDRACRGEPLEIFFEKTNEAKAKAICRTCPVLHECRRDTLGEPYGVWGGRTAKQRKAIRKRTLDRAASWSRERRLEWGRICHDIYRRVRDWGRVRECTGLAGQLAEELAREWRLFQESNGPTIPEGPKLLRPNWPKGRPRADAWVWHSHQVRAANILGRTADSQWYRVQTFSGRAHVQPWVHVGDIQIFTTVEIPVMERLDRERYNKERRRRAA
nr:WhiB family transcriptional regulator [Streptomyces hoynatensis]